MAKPQRHYLIPQYMQKFSCIGPQCEDTCCNGWTVSIDKNAYKKYQKLQKGDLRTDIKKNIKYVKDGKSEYFAEIIMSDSGCNLQDENGLCRIHGELGESYLSNTCTIYPRMYNDVNNVLEMGGSVSCPEIARLALLSQDGIEFDMVSQEDYSRKLSKYVINTKENNHKHFWEIRSFIIHLLQDRRFSIEERLINVGIWLNSNKEKFPLVSGEQLSYMINTYEEILSGDDLKSSLNNIKSNYSLNLVICKELLRARKLLNIQSKRYIELINTVTNELLLEENNENTFSERIIQIKESFYLPFIEKHEYVLENYLVNDVFINCFSNNPNKVFEDYIILVIKFALIKIHLYGVASKNKGLNTELAIFAIQAFSKGVDHNSLYLKGMLEIMGKNNLDSLAHMAILIKG